MPWAYFTMAAFPSPARNTRGFFSDLYCENLIGLLEVKLTKVWGASLRLSPSGVVISHTCPHRTSSNLSTRFSNSDTGSQGVFCSWASESLYLPVCYSNFHSSGLPYDLSSLTDLRRVVGFQFV